MCPFCFPEVKEYYDRGLVDEDGNLLDDGDEEWTFLDGGLSDTPE